MSSQLYIIEFRAEDREKADKILYKHWEHGDIDTVQVTTQKRGDTFTNIFWIKLCVSEDLETIKNEFRENGIELF